MPAGKTTERRAEILRIMQELGIHNVPITALAQKYNCSRQTLHKDVNRIIQQTPPDDITHIKWGLQNTYKKCEKELMKILANPESSVQEKINATRALASVVKDFSVVFESYSMKQKVADNVNVNLQPRKLTIEEIQAAFQSKENE
ncbi:HTH domain-containing protein [Candidatus Woesearchaeota archaeon]|nr:HTH domain-containing protein [Candidatus Woesearchaeota archaeon]